MKMLAVLLGLIGLIAACKNSAAAAPKNDLNWECYDAQPGHPTRADRTDFIDNLVPTALEAERYGGPPAAGLLAMSASNPGSVGPARRCLQTTCSAGSSSPLQARAIGASGR